ncbi:MAG: tetratricopeptide repeat protein [Fimbriimonadales bacterium]|nr:tetratricopeptide repeat protein [Fimbriimonadales bacterium]
MSDTSAKELVTQAVDRFESGDLDGAIDLARQAIDSDSRNADGFSVLGIALAQAGREEEATEALQRAIQTSPYTASHYYNLALHHYHAGHKNDAMSMAQEAIRTDGKHRRAIALLKMLEEQTHVEVAPYTTSLGDNRGSAYRYKAEESEGDGAAGKSDIEAPPIQAPGEQPPQQ